MTLTAWNNTAGGSDWRTRVIVVHDCDGLIEPKQSYRTIGDQIIVNATTQTDPTSDGRFQPIMRVHLSSHPISQRSGGLGKGTVYNVFHDDLASVWTVNLMAVAAAPAPGASAVATTTPEIQWRLIQSNVGNQVKRATMLYKPTTAAGSLGMMAQLSGVESTDLEIWGWIDPEVNGTGGAAVSLMVGVKMGPHSMNEVILGDDYSAIP